MTDVNEVQDMFNLNALPDWCNANTRALMNKKIKIKIIVNLNLLNLQYEVKRIILSIEWVNRD